MVLVMLVVAVAAIAVSACGGSNEQEKTSASIERTVEQDITKAGTFNKLFREFPNPGATGPAASDTAASGDAALSGNTGLIAQEQQCVKNLDNPGWYETMVPAEHGNSWRTHLFECANFTGDFSADDNQVYAYEAPAKLGGSIYDAVTAS